MATASVTYSFTALTKAQAAQVNQNFSELVTFANNSTVHVDGSKSMTGALTLPNADPTNNNHAARKKYVDDAVGMGGWTTYTPTMTQSGTVTATASRAKYVQIGKTVFVSVGLDVTGSGTGGNAIEVTLPVNFTAARGCVGSFYYFDTGSTIYTGTVVGEGTNKVRFYVSGNGNPMGVNPNFAAANTDVLVFAVSYEVA